MDVDGMQSSFNQFFGTLKYIVSPELCNIVNVVIALQRPLLVRSEPGTGKTLLTHAIAEAKNKNMKGLLLKIIKKKSLEKAL